MVDLGGDLFFFKFSYAIKIWWGEPLRGPCGDPIFLYICIIYTPKGWGGALGGKNNANIKKNRDPARSAQRFPPPYLN